MGRLQCTVAHWPKADMTVRDSDVRFSQNDVEPCSARRKYLMWSVQRWEESRRYMSPQGSSNGAGRGALSAV